MVAGNWGGSFRSGSGEGATLSSFAMDKTQFASGNWATMSYDKRIVGGSHGNHHVSQLR